jgi:hypothetical protein
MLLLLDGLEIMPFQHDFASKYYRSDDVIVKVKWGSSVSPRFRSWTRLPFLFHVILKLAIVIEAGFSYLPRFYRVELKR